MNSKLLLCLALVLSSGLSLASANDSDAARGAKALASATEAGNWSRLAHQVLGWLLGIFCVWITTCRAEDRIWIEAKINEQPVRLFFDSGADHNVLFKSAARRLGITFTNPPKDIVLSAGQVPLGFTEECALTIGETTVKTRMRTVDIPAYMHSEADGVIGWGSVQSNIFLIDASHRAVKVLGKIPEEVAAWKQFRVQENVLRLNLEIPEDGSNKLILIDTGFEHGVALSPARWQQWRTSHAKQPTTLEAGFMPGAGLVVREVALAHEIALGPLCLTNVPIMEAYPPQVALSSPGFEAALGLAALRRVEILVDSGHNTAYIKFNSPEPFRYEYNRLGAIFVPDIPTSEDLVARVQEETPAWEVGIRNGDILLKINDLDVTRWRTTPGVLPLSRFWEAPAGTNLHLVLRRGDKTFEKTVSLRDILNNDT